MSIEETVWEAQPHTLAKHRILDRYLKAWLPILSAASNQWKTEPREVLFIDGFAGPGVYKGGELGSPVIAARAAVNHIAEFPRPVRMLFIEERDDRHKRLTTEMEPWLRRSTYKQNLFLEPPIRGTCEETLNGLLNDYEAKNKTFGPALAFFDQFGYAEVSMDLIGRILRYESCEVFTYLSYFWMNRFISDETKEAAYSRAYGGDEWKECRDLSGSKRLDRMLELYVQALRNRAKCKYARPFMMYDENNTPLYWLVFCTNNLRGLEEMKKAMWQVDRTGEYRFSDAAVEGQQRLIGSYTEDVLADDLVTNFKGRQVTAEDVWAYALEFTPGLAFRPALNLLVAKAAITVSRPPGCKSGFPDDKLKDITIQFRLPERQQTMF